MRQLIKRTKPYKAKLPSETIDNIKVILEGIGLQFAEKQVDGNNLFKACSLGIINTENKEIIFSTYGKGNSSEWASASAWGEMIERIQNLAFYMILIFPSDAGNQGSAEFTYFPDEKVFDRTNSDPSFINNYKNLTGIQTIEEQYSPSTLGLPFYSVFDKKNEYFPFRALQVIVGSNGMCSGNTREEALIQGISEVFERFVLKAFYLNPFCPPDIPLSHFKGLEIWVKISKLIKEQKLVLQIKDCSMGRGYPVIGVLIKNNKNGYVFHLGADPSPVTALERCFTEIFQAGTIRFQSIDELNKNLPYDLTTDYWKKNLSLTISSYSGQWPPAILDNNPAYTFSFFEHSESVSDNDDLRYLLKILKRENRKIFVRDNSFLKHPAYYIYIPGMSEITSFPDNSFSTSYLDFDNYLPLLINIKKSTRHARMKMKRCLEDYIETSPVRQFNPGEYFKFCKKHPFSRLSSSQFIDLIDFSLLDGTLADNFNMNEIKSNMFLSTLCEKDPYFKPAEIFTQLIIPDCFECAACNLKAECNLTYALSVWERLRESMKSVLIDQNDSFKSVHI